VRDALYGLAKEVKHEKEKILNEEKGKRWRKQKKKVIFAAYSRRCAFIIVGDKKDASFVTHHVHPPLYAVDAAARIASGAALVHNGSSASGTASGPRTVQHWSKYDLQSGAAAAGGGLSHV